MNTGGFIRIRSDFPEQTAAVKAGGKACWLYIRLICWCNRWFSKFPPGFVPSYMIRGSEKRHMACLVEAGLATEVEEGFQLNLTYVRFHPRGSQRKQVSFADREAVYKRDNFRCVGCGTDERLSIDHIIPVSKGGAHHIDNFQTLCRSCNSQKGAKL